MSQVVKFYPANAAENPDLVLEQAQGLLSDVLIIGYDKDGDFFAASSERFADGGELLWVIEVLKAKLMSGELMGDAE